MTMFNFKILTGFADIPIYIKLSLSVLSSSQS